MWAWHCKSGGMQRALVDGMTNVDTIRDTDISDRTAELATTLLEASQYTTLALYAVSMSLVEMGDETGAELVRAFAAKFAEHEAGQL